METETHPAVNGLRNWRVTCYTRMGHVVRLQPDVADVMGCEATVLNETRSKQYNPRWEAEPGTQDALHACAMEDECLRVFGPSWVRAKPQLYSA